MRKWEAFSISEMTAICAAVRHSYKTHSSPYYTELVARVEQEVKKEIAAKLRVADRNR